MFALAPLTRLTHWLTWSRSNAAWFRLGQTTIGMVALNIARKEIGNGEEGDNNRGPNIDRYRNYTGGKGSWCAAFIYYCLASTRLPVPFKRTHGARKLFRLAAKAGTLVGLQDIQEGDLVLWARGDQGSWKAHIGIVSRVARNEAGKVVRFHYIAGNEGRFPSRVKEREGTSKRRRIGFARLP